jgi:nitroimidazol reductase NimA-like FMN-containing flavoprotein (pyridoxamine 5'-phosphate oxidase superfamily)
MGIALADNVKQLLDRSNFAHLATLMEDGSPLSTPVWVGREGDRIIVCTSGKSLKARNTQRDPRVAISWSTFRIPIASYNFVGAWLSIVPTLS